MALAARAHELTWMTSRSSGYPIRLNTQDFVAIDRDREAKYEATYRPQALYNRADEGFHANNEAFLLHEVATNLPIYRDDTGPTDFHLHLPPVSSSCWSRPACSPSTMMAACTMSAPAR